MHKFRMLKIYYHPTCITSYKLLRRLYDEGFLDEVDLIDTSLEVGDALSKEIFSVPWIEDMSGNILLAGPVNIDIIVNWIDKGAITFIGDATKEILFRNFINGLVDSQAASTLAVVHWSLRPLMTTKFLEATTWANIYRGGIELLEKLRMDILEREENILRELFKNKLRATLSIGFMRELYWAYGGILPERLENISPPHIALWMLSKASIGRVGLPFPTIREDFFLRILEIYDWLAKNYIFTINYIKKEQKTITSDEDLWIKIKKKL